VGDSGRDIGVKAGRDWRRLLDQKKKQLGARRGSLFGTIVSSRTNIDMAIRRLQKSRIELKKQKEK